MDSITSLHDFYAREADRGTRTLARIQRAIARTSLWRILVFGGGVAGLVCARHEDWWVLVLIAVAALLPFVWLMKRHNRLFARRDETAQTVEVCRQELAALALDTSAFDGGDEFVDPSHRYAFDLDLFGPRSLFQYVNRTCTQPGRQRLAAWFTDHLESKAAIDRRQEAVRELSAQPDFCRRFRVTGLLHKGQAADEAELCAWASDHSHFRSRRVLRLLPAAVTATNVLLLALVLAGAVPTSAWGMVWGCCLVGSFGFTHRISRLQDVYGRKLQVLGTYARLLRLMDGMSVRSACLDSLVRQVGQGQGKASAAIARLDYLMNALDQRNNYLMYALLNGTFFWELWQIMRIEAWRECHGRDLPAWLDAIGQMDALCSLGTFAFNHPDYAYPVVLDRGQCPPSASGRPFFLQGEALGHPLMRRDACVPNDVRMTRRPAFLIITGANMAGKSTYLRTVGVNYVLACVGAPVCARSLTLYPARLLTSLRTSDSLADHESYFFAELKRLKFIIDRLHAGDDLFIILDEILKGTNSADKQKGSLALIRQLMALQANGIIATHDLVLGTLKDSYPDDICNACFEADVVDNELHFSYRLRPGVARNMNACFLMKKMGIAVAE